MKHFFKPEFINRIDEIIVFHPLNKSHMKDILSIMMKDMEKRASEQMGLSIEIDDKARDYLINKGYDEKYGARPLRRTLQNCLEDAMAEEILDGKIKQGDTVYVTAGEEGLKISSRELINN